MSRRNRSPYSTRPVSRAERHLDDCASGRHVQDGEGRCLFCHASFALPSTEACRADHAEARAYGDAFCALCRLDLRESAR